MASKHEGRRASWKGTTDVLANAIGIAMFVQLVGSPGSKVYNSAHLKKGICAAGLLKWQSLMMSLITLDPRGGYFSQLDMEQVVDKLYEGATPDTKAKVQQCAGEDVRTVKAYLARLAYTIRVMLSHCRQKFRKEDKDAEFADLFACFTAPVGARAEAKSSGSQAKLTAKANPFMHFRDEEEELGCTAGNDEIMHEDSGSDGEEVVVATYYDAHLCQCFQLTENGILKQALWYQLGPNGFVVAAFENDIEVTTEVPNDHLHDGAILKMPAPPPTRPPTKRDTAKAKGGTSKRPAANDKMVQMKLPRLRVKTPATERSSADAPQAAVAGEADGPDDMQDAEDASAGEADEHESLSAVAPMPDPDGDAAPLRKIMRLKLVNGHCPEEVCVHLCTKAKDKAQVLRHKFRAVQTVAAKQEMLKDISCACAAWLDDHKHQRVCDLDKTQMAVLRGLAVCARDVWIGKQVARTE